jgi:UDP-N-acetylglucosamine--N-acetylmuramyl-(pentapeptide) pyrophosphoryl-undecaprenol N-acetylglucosamine transferase
MEERFAAADHQRTNARALERAGAAVMLEEKDLSGAALAAAVRALVDEPARIAAMEEAARRVGRPDAAARVADLLLGTEDTRA